MELFDLSHLHALTAYLHANPAVGGIITFAIAFIESIALIGGLIPGSVTMTAIGALIGSGAMPMVATIAWAIAGAFVGDFLSYGIGAYYNERLKLMWPFRTHPQWLMRGQNFFKEHGGKSVLIGRFFGPIRSLVPLVAGLMHLSMPRFILSALLAAVLWSVLYIAPGIVVGALSLELPPATATKFILTILGIVAFGWVIVVLIHLFFKTLVRWADRTMDYIWACLEKHPSTHWITFALSDSNKANQHRQLTLVFLVLLCIVLFSYLLYCNLTQSHLAHLNTPVFELLRSLRSQLGHNIFTFITLLGDRVVQMGAGILIFAWLFWKRYRRAAWHWLGLVALSTGLVELIKRIHYSPRPAGLLHQLSSSSFPSGHTTLVTASLGFLAMLITHHLPTGRRKAPLLIAGCLILSILFSRLYLGAHWLTDVLAGLAVGLACAAAMIVSYLRADGRPLPAAALGKVSLTIFAVLWLGYGLIAFHKQREDTTLYWPTVTMDTETWWQLSHPEIPLFILSRLGKPEAALNVQWLDSLENIRKTLIKAGWQEHPVHLNWKGSLNRLSPKANPEHLPVWPALYQNQSPVLMMTQQKNQRPPLYFVLWKSNITLSNSDKTLWVGNVHYFIPHVQKNALPLTQAENYQLYQKAMAAFMLALNKTLLWQIWTLPPAQQPAIMHSLNWDGKLLLIRHK